MQTFVRFDPAAYLEISVAAVPSAKVAKAAKEAPEGPAESHTLAALATLAARLAVVDFSAWTDDHEERAAVVQFEGGVPRDWAEGFARLDLSRPPADVPPARWRRFIDDCGQFLDGKWPARAAALGWGPLDLFGCHRTRPFARIERAGLLWLLNGCRLTMLTEDAAVIDCGGGTWQTYRRVPGQAGSTLAWELMAETPK